MWLCLLYGEGLLVSYILLVERNTRYMTMRHNADWQTHNYPSLCEKNWSKRGGPQCRVILLKSGIPPEFAGMAGYLMQVSKNPVPTQDVLFPN